MLETHREYLQPFIRSFLRLILLIIIVLPWIPCTIVCYPSTTTFLCSSPRIDSIGYPSPYTIPIPRLWSSVIPCLCPYQSKCFSILSITDTLHMLFSFTEVFCKLSLGPNGFYSTVEGVVFFGVFSQKLCR